MYLKWLNLFYLLSCGSYWKLEGQTGGGGGLSRPGYPPPHSVDL